MSEATVYTSFNPFMGAVWGMAGVGVLFCVLLYKGLIGVVPPGDYAHEDKTLVTDDEYVKPRKP